MLPDSLFLCATSRLAQTLRGELPETESVWQTRQAMTLGQWFSRLAEEALLCGVDALPQALDPYAEKMLWEQVIAESLTTRLADAAPLFDLPGLAASAMEAHALCRAWQLKASGGADETRLFVGWQAGFVERCRQAGWVDAAGLHERLIGLLEAGHLALPERVVLAGFDRLTRLEQALAAALVARGVIVEYSAFPATIETKAGPRTIETKAGPGTTESTAGPRVGRDFSLDSSIHRVFACADSEAECHAVVAWAKRHLAANPAARLGIVAPDLASVRDRLSYLLDDALHPDAIRPDAAEMPRNFNFSLGRPLAEMPVVRSALDLLALGSGRAKQEQGRLSALLLAGFWGASYSESDELARLDASLRRDLPYFTTPDALLRLAARLAEQAPALAPDSMAALRAGLELLTKAPRSQRPGDWGRCFRRALAAFGWPGERPLSSHEFQARRAFVEVLDTFGRFDAVLGPLTQGAALSRLRELCRQRAFQPETRGRPAIQVLGVLESAGLSFDALWVMGMNDDRWPPPPRPNPLLPAEAQRLAGSAHACAEVELDFARRVHARLMLAAPEVDFSWSRADGNRVLRASPLLADLPAAVDQVERVKTLSTQLAGQAAWVCIDDAQAPPVGSGEKVAGGSWLLRAQAICPAWAFYQFRLAAEPLDMPLEGLDPAARGTLVHGALEVFWQAVQGAEALTALAESGGAALRQAIAEAVDKALAIFELETRTTLPPRFRQLEAGRLCRLLERWLAFEATRPEAFTVIACERQEEVEIEGIRVKMVVDRIDQLDDGRQIIIDYKTGAAIDTKNWAAQRITEPQLPIYAALVNDEVVAVVFAKVLLDKPAFAGVAETRDILPGVQGLGDDKQKVFPPAEFPDWVAVVTHWRERLHAVAREVKEGVAGVSFADADDLRYCDVLPLLRLPERRQLLQAMYSRPAA
jgi:probable DNA repair protein